MHVNPYGEEPVRFAAELANERPASIGELRDRCRAAGVVIPARVSKDDLAQTMAMIDEWLAIVDTPAEQARAERVNAMLARYASYPRITDHAGDGWHIHFREDHCPLSQVLAIIIAVGTALHLSQRGMHRLGRCGAGDCDRVFADFSRTGTQRYCSIRCSNRDAVRRHRARSRVSLQRG
jgi:hypothetical protein